MRQSMADVSAGKLDGWSDKSDWFEVDGEAIEVAPRDVAAGLLNDSITARAEAIEAEEGRDRADTFVGIALGRVTPFSLHISEWLAEPGQKGVFRGRTLADYRRIVEAFQAWMAKEAIPATVEQVTRRIAGRYLAILHGQALSPARVRTVVAALSGYWQWMARRGVIGEASVNPWTGQAPRKAKGAPQEPERSFTAAEMVALLASPPDAAMGDLMRLGALSGMRIEEACRLTVAMCADGVFQVPGTKTNAARRAVPIHTNLEAMVAGRSKGRVGAAYLFEELGDPNRFGDRGAAISKRFGRYRETVGVHEREEGRRRSKVNFHSFRRWFITKALQAGQPARVVQQVVGHKLQGMTEGVYFGGDTLDAKRACVEAVRLPVPSPPSSAA